MDDRITITKLSKEQGWWTARVSCNGTTIEVHRRYGSWQAEVPPHPGSRQRVTKDVLPHVAALLQEKVRPIENRERRIQEKVEENIKTMPNLFLN